MLIIRKKVNIIFFVFLRMSYIIIARLWVFSCSTMSLAAMVRTPARAARANRWKSVPGRCQSIEQKTSLKICGINPCHLTVSVTFITLSSLEFHLSHILKSTNMKEDELLLN